MKYDVIVVGSGSAGSIVATRISEDPSKSVLLIEAGPDSDEIEKLPDEVRYGYATGTDVMVSDHNWQFLGQPTPIAEPMMVPRGKVTGGSSAINGQMFLRGVPEDYDTWAEWGNDKWSYEQLLPFFRNLETDTDFSDDFHGTTGPIIVRRFKPTDMHPAQVAFREAALDAGHLESPDLNHPDSEGISPTPLNNPNGIRWSTNLGYLSMSRHRLNLTIRPNCDVRKILFEGKKAYGLEVESAGEVFTVEGDEIVLSGGAIASPQILMLSGVGPSDHLKEHGIDIVHELSGVGENLRDHPIVPVSFKTKSHVELDGLAPRNQYVLRYTASGSDLRNDMIIIMQSFATDRVDRGGARMDGFGVRMTLSVYLAKSAGKLTLQSSDPSVQPFLNYNYFDDPFDRERMREGIYKCLDLAKHPKFEDLVEEVVEPYSSAFDSDDSLDEWMMKEATTGHHISGTCKMGPSTDHMAVVDQYGKVHGLENLRVADASVMPDCIRANTNVTTMMIGERISDFMINGE